MAAGMLGILLLAGGGSALGVAAVSQDHAPQPAASQGGGVGPRALHSSSRAVKHLRGERAVPAPVRSHAAHSSPAATPTTLWGPLLPRSLPVSLDIQAIGVHSAIQQVGLTPDGTIEVPPLNDPPFTNEAAWYQYSPTPGQLGPSIIEGHVDSAAEGPSVFFQLGALQPGDQVKVALQDGTVAVFAVDVVREYPKDQFPTATVYGNIPYAGLRLLTCGGSFDDSTGHYLSNTWSSPVTVCHHGGHGRLRGARRRPLGQRSGDPPGLSSPDPPAPPRPRRASRRA